jgi:type III restriction enzyme
MKLQFTHQDYQTRAVQAVVQVFDGQPLARSAFALAAQTASVQYAADGSIGNALVLSDEQLLSNVQAVQQTNGIAASTALVASVADKKSVAKGQVAGEDGVAGAVGSETFCPLNFSIEMETGTGKTYAFIKTMYELNQTYGFKKFVIVVPSVAIREGTMKNLAVTRSHFAADYANVPCVAMLYDSSKLTDLRHFSQSDALSVLVMNVDSFTKDNNKINQKGERAFAPIEYIRAVNPIVIVDEPQNFETDIRRKALADLNPLCTLRYSATHKNPYNLLYSLNPVQAYDLGLVKQIEVDGVQADADHNRAFIELLSIDAKPKGITAKVRIDVNSSAGVKRKDVVLKVGDDLFKKSNQRDVYEDGYILNEIRAQDDEVEFSGGRVLRLHEQQGGLQDDVQRFQIERTVAAHFAKLKKLQPIGVKVLSLFFIDKVANYRGGDEDGNKALGKFGVWFEAAFNQYAAMPKYAGLIPHEVSAVHDGYFSGDKKGKGAAAKTVWIDSTERGSQKDDDTYALIMKDKERLLDSSVPLQFIFSHSALREGWDNPNVFQICTLNDTHSAVKKRQEIGRGLRLCVNQAGERVLDKEFNVLTVIPNESYESFAKSLQQEIKDETGVSFAGRTKNAKAKALVKRKALNAEEAALFKAIWDKISYQTRYTVQIDTPKLVAACVAVLSDQSQYPKVQAPKIRALKAELVMAQDGLHGREIGRGQTETNHAVAVPDVYASIQNRVHVSRSSIFKILDGSQRMGELLVNAQAFLDTVVAAIKDTLQALLVEGIEYHTINGQRYQMSLLDEPIEAYASSIYPQEPSKWKTPIAKTLLEAQLLDGEKNAFGDAFSCVLSDSEVESTFAHDCTLDERVKFFFKLPSAFKIPTPLGSYNPDWAVVFENDVRVYFVAETKSSLVHADRRPSENLKIACGIKHFALSEFVSESVRFKTVKTLEDLLPVAARSYEA